MRSFAKHAGPFPTLGFVFGEDTEILTEKLLDALPVGVYVCDAAGHVLRYNRVAAELWGRSPALGDPGSLFCGSHRLHNLDGKHIPHAKCPMAAVLASGEALRDQEIVIERPDGSRIFALANIEPLKDPEGNVTGAINVFRDSSEQRRRPSEPIEQGRRLQDILQALPAAVYTTDAEGRLDFYNQAAVDLWGVGSDLLGQEFCGSWKLYRPDGTPLPHDECPMALALKEKRAIRGVEAVAERPDGTRIPFLPYPTPLFDESGELVGAVNMLLNLTAQKESESLLRSSERRYRAIFENAQVSVWEKDFSSVLDLFHDLRAKGVIDLRAYMKARPDVLREAIGRMRVKDANSYTLELFEAESADALAAALNDVLAEESVPALIEAFAAIWEEKRTFECETVLKSLTGRPMDVVFSASFGGERLESSIVSIHDVSRRKASEMAAQTLAAIVESSEDAILAKNLDGIIQSWNRGAERLFGYTAEEAIGQPVLMLIPEDRRSEEESILSRIRRGQPISHYETVRRRKDGSLVHISLSVSPIKLADGTIIGASKIARDITERTLAAEQQQLLLREMNHRIKNLIALSSGLVSLSARAAKTPAELVESVQQRFLALARAHEMILPRPGAAEHDRKPATTLHKLIRTITSPHDNTEDGTPARFVIQGSDIQISRQTATSFALLFHEFATNAVKYGALAISGGSVEIECSDKGSQFVIEWRERGGPPVDPHSIGSEGFGDLLSRATVKGQLRGRITRQWEPEGLVLRLEVPREHLTS